MVSARSVPQSDKEARTSASHRVDSHTGRQLVQESKTTRPSCSRQESVSLLTWCFCQFFTPILLCVVNRLVLVYRNPILVFAGHHIVCARLRHITPKIKAACGPNEWTSLGWVWVFGTQCHYYGDNNDDIGDYPSIKEEITSNNGPSLCLRSWLICLFCSAIVQRCFRCRLAGLAVFFSCA